VADNHLPKFGSETVEGLAELGDTGINGHGWGVGRRERGDWR
jgi:hypothetical protein